MFQYKINEFKLLGDVFEKKKSGISLNKIDIMGKVKNVGFDEFFENLKIIFKTVFFCGFIMSDFDDIFSEISLK